MKVIPVEARVVAKTKQTIKRKSDNKEFEKHLVVIETGGEFSKQLACETLSEKLYPIIDKLLVGDVVIADIVPSSREHEGKWYSQINLIGIKAMKEPGVDEEEVLGETPDSDGDDLPF